MQFVGKACIVTGGARGIGKAIVESLLQRGAKVLFVDILYREGEATEREFSEKYGAENAIFLRVDVASHTNFESAFLKCIDKFGGIDILVNNAGTNAESSWETQMEINLLGTIRGVKLAVRYMGKNGRDGETTGKGGVVLNISSIQALLSWPAMPTYSAAKAGIVAYTRCAGHKAEYDSHGVRIVCLCPFGVETPMQDFERINGMTEVGKIFLNNVGVKCDIMTSSEVGEGVCEVIEKGSPASVWYMHKTGEKPYEIPDQNTWENLMNARPKNYDAV